MELFRFSAVAQDLMYLMTRCTFLALKDTSLNFRIHNIIGNKLAIAFFFFTQGNPYGITLCEQ